MEAQLSAILNFWYPAAVDRRRGGYLNLLDADGSVLDSEQKHLVASARFAVLFSMGTLAAAGGSWSRQAAADAVDFLWRAHRDPRHGGYFWILRGDQPVDRRKQSYGHAFVLLAGAMAHRAGIDGAQRLLEDAVDVAERQFFRGGDLALNTASEDFRDVTPYRGQNPNMHFCEAFIAAYEATGHAPYLERAYRIADVLARQLATRIGGFVWENYDAGWRPDWERRPRDASSLEASSGVSPGHQIEWAKLLGILARHRDADWLLPQAVHLYRLGWDFGWNRRDGGFVNGLNRRLEVEDARPSYWSPSEAIGGAAVLAAATGNEDYWADYERTWDYALTHLVDAEHGGWFKAPALAAARKDARKGDGLDPDYHPAGACFEALRCLDEAERNRKRQSGAQHWDEAHASDEAAKQSRGERGGVVDVS